MCVLVLHPPQPPTVLLLTTLVDSGTFCGDEWFFLTLPIFLPLSLSLTLIFNFHLFAVSYLRSLVSLPLSLTLTFFNLTFVLLSFNLHHSLFLFSPLP